MRDPLLIIDGLPPSQYYEKKSPPPGGWPKRTAENVDDLLEALNRAHQNIRFLVQEKDRIIDQGNCLVAELKRERRWRRAITAALAASWVSWFAAAKMLVPYAVRGLMK